MNDATAAGSGASQADSESSTREDQNDVDVMRWSYRSTLGGFPWTAGENRHGATTAGAVASPTAAPLLTSRVLVVATACYALSFAVGLGAAAGKQLGALHHVCFALTWISTSLALLLDFRVGLLLVGLVLAAFPYARPHTREHVALALSGAVGHALAWWR
jgi:hypothetical protein